MSDSTQRPNGYAEAISDYRACIFDGVSGEPIGWGFQILVRLGEEKFDALREHGDLECIYPSWFLITKKLSREEAIAKYGKVTSEKYGPRGGWHAVTFGTTTFCSDWLRPPKRST